MSEINDQDFLRVNRFLDLVPAADVETVQREQITRLQERGEAPDLVDLLVDRGILDGEKITRMIACRDALEPGSDQAAPATPLVAISSRDVVPPSGNTVHLPASASTPTTSRRRPPEVEEADGDPNNRFGHFVLLKEVGRGGMGRVYRAWDNSVGRIVALKVIETPQEENRERFVREAEIAGRLHHPAIATVYQAGTARGRSYIAMQFIEGAPVGKTRLPAARAIELTRDAARALSYAHEKGIIHRDIKPGNLMIDLDGKLFLTDFGLAKQVEDDAAKQISVTGEVMGTPQFMSPEQASGDRKSVDARSDVYSLGATLYALLADRPPFTAQGIGPLLMEVMEKRATPLREINPEFSPEMESVVDRAMEKEPPKRYATASEFADALDRLLEEERFVGSAGLARRLARRWIPVAAVCFALAGAVRLWLPGWIAEPPPSGGAGETAGLLFAATISQTAIETGFGDLAPGARRERIEADVLRRVGRILAADPEHAGARVLRARALYVDGRFGEAKREFEAVEAPAGDYRVAFFLGLLRLREELERPPPLPSVDAPYAEWEHPPAPGSAELAESFRAVAGAEPSPSLGEEHARDRPAARALVALLESRWGEAADRLDEVVRDVPLPVYRRARGRAAYLARRWESVTEDAGSREQLGAALARAGTSLRSLRELEEILARAGDDAWAAATIRAALARRSNEAGGDPEPHAAAGLKLISGETPRERELRGVLEAARLHRRALSGTDSEKGYLAASQLLGDSPSGWTARLAAVELRLGWGSFRSRRKGDADTIFEQALAGADALTREASDWTAPRLLRAEARVRQGQVDDAGSELQPVLNSEEPGVRARILAAEVNLARAERLHRRRDPFAGDAREARKYAMDALAVVPDHAEALVPAAAAAILLAQDAAARDEDAGALVEAATEQLNRTLEQIPEYARARTYRGVAHFLRGAAAQGGGGDGRAENEAALADLDRALAAVPELDFARYMRGIVRFSLGRYGEAMKDWKRLLAGDESWDTEELRTWMEDARSRSVRKE